MICVPSPLVRVTCPTCVVDYPVIEIAVHDVFGRLSYQMRHRVAGTSRLRHLYRLVFTVFGRVRVVFCRLSGGLGRLTERFSRVSVCPRSISSTGRVGARAFTPSDRLLRSPVWSFTRGGS